MRADYIIEPILIKETKLMNTPLLLNQLSIFSISGNDARDFLNNQIISTLPQKEDVIYSAICNPKGRIQFSLYIFSTTNGFFVAVNKDLSDNFFHYVSLRKFRMDFTINKTNKFLLAHTSPTQQFDQLPIELLDHEGEHPMATDEQFWLFTFSLQLPWITQATSEMFIPQHVNLDQQNIIAFDKGCYPGQEIIARLHYIGKVKKRMKLLTVKSPVVNTLADHVFIEDLGEKVEVCSPTIQTEGGWQFQAICPNK